jgi:hypothetical protein
MSHSRQAAGRELQSLIEQINGLTQQAERLAVASGGLVDPKYFRGAKSMMQMAAGDLDQKGLLDRKQDTAPGAAEAEARG